MSLLGPTVAVGIALAALLALVIAGSAAVRLWRERRYGTLVAVDLPERPGLRLSAPRWRLVGRPDELRALPDGRWVPVEYKSGRAPRCEPWRSHRVQVLAYCLLVEETTGRAPPFGLLRYGDGAEARVEWTAEAREELWRVRAAVARPYDGRADPSPGKCRACRWRSLCDVRAS